MYELSKPRSRGYWIILGIIVFAFITGVLRMAFDETPLSKDEEMTAIANEINRRAPMLLDSTTRFEGVTAQPGNKLQYNITLISSSKADFDSLSFSRLAKGSFVEQMRNNPKKTVFQQNQIILRAVYSDSVGRHIGIAEVLPSEY